MFTVKKTQEHFVLVVFHSLEAVMSNLRISPKTKIKFCPNKSSTSLNLLAKKYTGTGENLRSGSYMFRLSWFFNMLQCFGTTTPRAYM